MRLIDPDVELVAAGSSGPDMPTFGEWERTVLAECLPDVDHLSLHLYVEDADGTADNLATFRMKRAPTTTRPLRTAT